MLRSGIENKEDKEQADTKESKRKLRWDILNLKADLARIVKDVAVFIAKSLGQLGPCWQSTCSYIVVVMLIAYIIIGIAGLFCTFTKNCPVHNFSGAILPIILTAVLSLAISVAIAIYSEFSRTAIITTLILTVPMAIIIILVTIGYLTV